MIWWLLSINVVVPESTVRCDCCDSDPNVLPSRDPRAFIGTRSAPLGGFLNATAASFFFVCADLY
jgi:hypothetical protein